MAELPGYGKPLNNQEVNVLLQIAYGKSEAEICKALFISKSTITRHVVNARAKLGATNRVHMVMLAAKAGYLDLDHISNSVKPQPRLGVYDE